MGQKFKTIFILAALLTGWSTFAQTRTEKDLLGEKQIPTLVIYFDYPP